MLDITPLPGDIRFNWGNHRVFLPFTQSAIASVVLALLFQLGEALRPGETLHRRVAMTLRPIRRALLSVSDKTGLIDFAKGLAQARHDADLDRRHGEGAARCGT